MPKIDNYRAGVRNNLKTFEDYRPKVEQVLRTDDFEIYETNFGLAVVKGNYRPSLGFDLIRINGFDFDLDRRVLHERVLFLKRGIPIRSHEETNQEMVENIGENSVTYVMWDDSKEKLSKTVLKFGESMRSVDKYDFGFYHGFELNDGRPGLLYVAKTIWPKYVEDNSFRMPENTYKSKA